MVTIRQPHKTLLCISRLHKMISKPLPVYYVALQIGKSRCRLILMGVWASECFFFIPATSGMVLMWREISLNPFLVLYTFKWKVTSWWLTRIGGWSGKLIHSINCHNIPVTSQALQCEPKWMGPDLLRFTIKEDRQLSIKWSIEQA